MAERRGEEGRERVEELEREVREVRREAAGLKGQLAASEEVYISHSATSVHTHIFCYIQFCACAELPPVITMTTIFSTALGNTGYILCSLIG